MLRALCGAALFGALTCNAAAQLPPNAGEVAQYGGLLAAAARGDAAEIKRLAAAGGDANARDGYGRTPLHVATYRKNRDAISALVRAGADINARENDRYDAVTIAGASLKLADRNGQTPLALAGSRHDAAMVQILEKAGAK